MLRAHVGEKESNNILVLRGSGEHVHQEVGRVRHNVNVVDCVSKHEDLQRGPKNNVIHVSQESVSWHEDIHELSQNDLHSQTHD